VVLGLVVEAVTGKKLEQVLAERLFEPLDLHATSFPHGLSVPEPFAHGYAFFQGALLDLTPVVDPSWAYAAGDLVSNAADVSSFFAALLRGRLMPAAFLRQMKSFSTTSRTYGLGLQGYFTRCGSAFGHAGDFIGWRNVVLAKADGRRVAVGDGERRRDPAVELAAPDGGDLGALLRLGGGYDRGCSGRTNA
jgi:D-alanyl-D-alanine carboxypeptidase